MSRRACRQKRREKQAMKSRRAGRKFPPLYAGSVRKWREACLEARGDMPALIRGAHLLSASISFAARGVEVPRGF